MRAHPRDADGLDREGYALLRGFVAGRDLEELHAAVDAKLLEPAAPGCQRPHNTLAPLLWNDDVVLRALSRQRRLAALRVATAAEDMRWISAYLSVKEGHSPPLWWHQDWWCWEHPVTYGARPPQVAVLCYLADTSPETGALRIVPGAHRRSVDLHGLLPEAHGEVAGVLDEWHPALRDHPDQRTLSVRAGDAVVIDYRLLHGTHANASPVRRECLILTFAPDWRRLPDEVRAHLIRHPALPQPRESLPTAHGGLLPDYDGTPRDLPLSRSAPAMFETGSVVAA